MLLLAGLDNPAAWTLDAGKGDRRVSNRPFPLGVALSLCDKSQNLVKMHVCFDVISCSCLVFYIVVWCEWRLRRFGRPLWSTDIVCVFAELCV